MARGALARHPFKLDVAAHGTPQLRQHGGELTHRGILAIGPPLVPPVVVAVLLAARFVVSGRLDVAVRVGADPDFLPGGRDGQVAYPPERLLVGDRGSLGVREGESTAALAAVDARARAVGATQPAPGRGRVRHQVVHPSSSARSRATASRSTASSNPRLPCSRSSSSPNTAPTAVRTPASARSTPELVHRVTLAGHLQGEVERHAAATKRELEGGAKRADHLPEVPERESRLNGGLRRARSPRPAP